MKRNLIPAAIGLAVLLTAPSLFAQSSYLRVEVPFQFVAGERVMPAGEYRVDIDAQFRRLDLRHSSGMGTFVSAAAVARKGDRGHGMLIFYKYGTSYVLRQVAAAEQAQSYALHPSRIERTLARSASGTQVAVLLKR